MKFFIATAAILISTISASATAGGLPAWCGTDKMNANSEDLRELTTSKDPADLVKTIARTLCSPDPDIDPHRGEIEQARQAWGKKLGLADGDWADVVAWIKEGDGTFKADRSTKLAAQLTPIDQFSAVASGFGDTFHGTDQIYAADILDASLSATGRMAFIDWCLKNDSVSREDGDMTKWAVCWPDVEKFDLQKVLAEVKADSAHTGNAKMWLRLHALGMAATIKDIAAQKAKLIKKDDTWQKVFDIAAKARGDWAKTVGGDKKLLDLASEMDSAAFAHSRKLLDGCEPKTDAALAAAVATVPSKAYAGMHDDREMSKPGFAESAGPMLVNVPAVYIAATAWAECHPKSPTADYLSEYLQRLPGYRGPRSAALGAIMGAEPDLKFDDVNAGKLGYPSWHGRPAERNGGAIMSAGGVVKSVKKGKDHLTVALQKTAMVQEDCVKEHRSNHVSRIRSDGAIEYELICDKTAMVKHDTTWTDFQINLQFEKVLKPGVVFSQVDGDVVAIWPNKSAKTPSWVLGASIK